MKKQENNPVYILGVEVKESSGNRPGRQDSRIVRTIKSGRFFYLHVRTISGRFPDDSIRTISGRFSRFNPDDTPHINQALTTLHGSSGNRPDFRNAHLNRQASLSTKSCLRNTPYLSRDRGEQEHVWRSFRTILKYPDDPNDRASERVK